MKSKSISRVLCAITIVGTLTGLVGCDRTTTTERTSESTSERRTVGTRESKGARTVERAKPEKPADKEDKTAENEAIEFHNNLYGFVGAANKPLEKIAKIMAESVGDANSNYSSDTSRWSSIRSFGFGDGFSKIPDYDLEAPEAFGSEDREFFNKGIKTVRDSVREIIAISHDLQKYYAAEDYKDDWYKKIYMTAPRIEELIATIRDTSGPLRERVDEITDEIDARNVATIPVGQWVLNMRGFMKKYRELTACLLREDFEDSSYGTGITPEKRQARIAAAQVWADKADSIIAELDEMAASQRTVTIEEYEGSRYSKIYASFYAEYDRTKIVTRRILRDLREKGSIHDQHNIKDSQRDVGRHLGDFTDLWNDKGRSGK